MSRTGRFSCVAIAATVAFAAGCRGGEREDRLVRGGRAYLAHCAVCHGTEGNGHGPLAATIAAEGRTPPPALDGARIAALGSAGVRSVIEGEGHRRKDSAMPLWGPHLGPDWTDRIAEFVVARPTMNDADRGAIARYLAPPDGTPPGGRRVYVLYCSSCHGPQGGGDGFFSPAFAAQIKPPPIRGSVLETLDDDALARLIGMGGTHSLDAVAMPGWLYTISPADRRALVGYMRALPGSPERE